MSNLVVLVKLSLWHRQRGCNRVTTLSPGINWLQCSPSHRCRSQTGSHLHNLGVASVARANLLVRHVWRFPLAVAGRCGYLDAIMQLIGSACCTGCQLSSSPHLMASQHREHRFEMTMYRSAQGWVAHTPRLGRAGRRAPVPRSTPLQRSPSAGYRPEEPTGSLMTQLPGASGDSVPHRPQSTKLDHARSNV